MNLSKVFMWAFDNETESGSAVAKGLGIKKINHENSKFGGGPEYTVINWGSTKVSKSVLRSRIINTPTAVARAVNKLAFFKWIGDKSRTVPWTTDPEVAKTWLQEGSKVVCRERLEGYEGQGITIVG